MRTVARVTRMAVGALAVVVSIPIAARAASAPAPTVLELRLTGVVDPVMADYLSDGIASAEGSGDAAVLITIDTPGGLDSSMREIIQSVLASRVPVICYVSPEGARAASAGTFIMMGCPVNAMAPGTNIGAAHPVGVAGAIEQEKVTNDAVAYIQSLATRNGRNAEWAKDAVVNSVSIPAEEALAKNVVDLLAPTTAALLDDLDGRMVSVAGGGSVALSTAGATVVTSEPGIGARLLHALLSPDFAFIFFYLGIGLIIVELLHPGISVPGILGALFLVAAFVTFGLLPVQIVGVVLLVASALFFLLELKHPGLGVPTVGGVACLILGGLTLFNPAVPNARVSLWTILPVAAVLVLFFATVVNAVLRAKQLPAETEHGRVVGATGVVERDLDPEGVVLVSSEQWTARSASVPVPHGAIVRVVAIEGLRLVVEPVREPTPAAPGREGGST